MNALVTGATGFLGSHLAAALHASGARVRVLVRPSSDLRRLAGLPVTLVRGTLEEAASLTSAVQGQDVVLHAAAKVPVWGSEEEYTRANLDGTRHLVDACQHAGVARFVYVSSLTVLGLPRTGAAVDESTPYAEHIRDPYTVSKIAAERLVLAANGQHGLTTTIVRPGGIWGPGETTIIPRLATLLRQGRLPYISGGHNRLALSHVRNLSDGILLAAGAATASGQVFHLTDGDEITSRAAIDILAAALGVRPPRWSAPFALVYAAATLAEIAARLARSPTPPPITRYATRLVASDARYSIAKAERELSYRPRVRFAEGIDEVVRAQSQQAR
jgi:nucleoside-diphosphate-sugar epimerase